MFVVNTTSATVGPALPDEPSAKQGSVLEEEEPWRALHQPARVSAGAGAVPAGGVVAGGAPEGGVPADGAAGVSGTAGRGARGGPRNRRATGRRARGRAVERLIEHRARRARPGARELEDERQPEEDAARPPARLGEQVARLPTSDHRLRRRRRAAEARREAAALPRLQEDRDDQDQRVEDEQGEQERVHRGGRGSGWARGARGVPRRALSREV
jgi:hypothetical protein